MPSKLTYAAVFAAFSLPAIVFQWPAAWLQGRLEQASRGRWSLTAAEGTIWNGGATLLLAEAAGGGDERFDARRWRAVQNIHWKLRWNEVWLGHLTFDTTLERGSVTVSINGSEVSLEKLEAQLPAMLLGGLISGPLGRYGWGGTLHTRAAAFRCSTHSTDCRGEIELIWRDASVAEIPGPVLGSYRLGVVGEGPSVHFDLSTQEGRLQVNGHGEAGAGGLRFSGDAAAVGADSGQLNAQLRTLGRPAGVPGKYIIEYREAGPS